MSATRRGERKPAPQRGEGVLTEAPRCPLLNRSRFRRRLMPIKNALLATGESLSRHLAAVFSVIRPRRGSGASRARPRPREGASRERAWLARRAARIPAGRPRHKAAAKKATASAFLVSLLPRPRLRLCCSLLHEAQGRARERTSAPLASSREQRARRSKGGRETRRTRSLKCVISFHLLPVLSNSPLFVVLASAAPPRAPLHPVETPVSLTWSESSLAEDE